MTAMAKHQPPALLTPPTIHATISQQAWTGEKVVDVPPVDVKLAFNTVCTAHLGRRIGSA